MQRFDVELRVQALGFLSSHHADSELGWKFNLFPLCGVSSGTSNSHLLARRSLTEAASIFDFCA